MEYEFEGLEETTDSLIFMDVVRKFGCKDFEPRTSFPKGNIKLTKTTEDKIESIVITHVVIERGDIYKPTKPLELVHDQAVIGVAYYTFHPKDSISASTISDIGIFKKLK